MTLQQECEKACEQIGIVYKDLPADGKLRPTAVIGKGGKNTAGRIKLFPDGTGGVVMNNIDATVLTFWKGDTPTKFTEADKTARAERIAREKQELEESRRKCREESTNLLDKVARDEVPVDHPYLISHGIRAYGIKYNSSGCTLVIPVISTDQVLHGLQFISGYGSKKFKTSTDKIGHFHKIEGAKDSTQIIICEGYATGASIREATGATVVIAFDAGNLLPVAKVLREATPGCLITIAADNDIGTQGNPGVTKAAKAAAEIGAGLSVVTFTDEQVKIFRSSHGGKPPTDFNDLHQIAGLDSVRLQINSAEPANIAQSNTNDIPEKLVPPDVEVKPLFISASEMLSQDPRVYPLIGKIIERGSTGQMFGPSGGGKTFVALDMACSVAIGSNWYNHQCENGVVIYFAGEGLPGLKRRLRAWHMSKGYPDLSNVHISRSTIILDPHGTRSVITEVRKLEENTGSKVALIVVDTLARHIQGDENNTQAMSEFVQSVDHIRDSFPGSTALIIHHSGNNTDTTNRSRGSSALKAAMDFEIQCKDHLLTFTKVKDGDTPEPIPFKLRPAQIGTDDDGEAITSCVVEYGECPSTHKPVTLTRFETMALDALITVCIAENDLQHQQYAGSLNAWREEFYRLRRIEDNTITSGTLKKSFQLVQGVTNRGGGLKGNRFVEFVEGRGAIPLRDSDQKHIFHTILANGNREHDGNMTGTVPVSGGREQGTHSLKSVPVFPSDITIPEHRGTFTEVDILEEDEAA